MASSDDDMDTLKQIGEYDRASDAIRRAEARAAAYRESASRFQKRASAFKEKASRFGKKALKFSERYRPFISTPREARGGAPVFKTPRPSSSRYLSSQYSVYKGGVADLKSEATGLSSEFKTLKSEEQALKSQRSAVEAAYSKASKYGGKSWYLPVKSKGLVNETVSVTEPIESPALKPGGVMSPAEISVGRFKQIESNKQVYSKSDLSYEASEDIMKSIKSPTARFIAEVGHFVPRVTSDFLRDVERKAKQPAPEKLVTPPATVWKQFEKHTESGRDIREDWSKVMERGSEYGAYLKANPIRASAEVAAMIGTSGGFSARRVASGVSKDMPSQWYRTADMKPVSFEEVVKPSVKTFKYEKPKPIEVGIKEGKPSLAVREGQTTLEGKPRFLPDRKPGRFNLESGKPEAPSVVQVSAPKTDRVMSFIDTSAFKEKQLPLAEYRPKRVGVASRDVVATKIKPEYELREWAKYEKPRKLSLFESKKAGASYQLQFEKPVFNYKAGGRLLRRESSKIDSVVGVKAKPKATVLLTPKVIGRQVLASQLKPGVSPKIQERVRAKPKEDVKAKPIVKVGTKQFLVSEAVSLGKRRFKTGQSSKPSKFSESIGKRVSSKKKKSFFVPNFKLKKSRKAKSKRRGLFGRRSYSYKPSLVGIGLPPVKRVRQKEFSGFEVRRVKL